MPDHFVFSREKFNHLFPFYIHINSQGIITGMGNSLQKICGDLTHTPFAAGFSISRPSLPSCDVAHIKTIIRHVTLLNSQRQCGCLLRGQFELLPGPTAAEDELVFVGSPWLSSIDELVKKNLTMNDFAVHDPMTDLLHVLKTQEITTNEIRELLKKVNQQKETLKARQLELERLSLVARTNRHGVALLDRRFYITWCNDAFTELSGFPARDVILQSPLRFCYKPENEHQRIREVKDALVRKEGIDTEFRIRRKDGTWFWCNVKIQVMGDSKHQDSYFVILENIHERKIADELLKESENRLSSLIMNLQSGVLVEDENRRIALTNHMFCRMFNIPAPPEALKGADCTNAAEQSKHLFADPQEFVKGIQAILKDRKIKLYDEIPLADGRTFERTYIPIFVNDQYKGHLWKYTDITQRKLHEHELEKQEEKYRSILGNLNLGLVELKVSGEIQYANQGFCHISGYSFHELKGKDILKFLTCAENESLLQEKVAMRDNDLTDTYQLPVRDKAGELKWWLVSDAIIYNNQGERTGYTALFWDFTRQKKLEEELLVAKQKAEESSKAKESFLANMSHEIRTPLNAIVGMVRELSKETLSHQQTMYLKHANAAIQHLLSIVNNILDISKIEAGEFMLDAITFSPRALLTETHDILQAAAEEKMLDMHFILDEQVAPAFVGDPNRLRQILINILSNSIKFTEKGTITVTCRASAQSASLQTLQFSITDTGIGMEAAYLKKLFSKFSQEDVSTGRKYGGTGLGMAITHDLIKLMQGTIAVFSEKGKGSRFEITLALPIGDPSEIEKDTAEDKRPSLHKTRILLVEDNELNRLVANNSLSYLNVSVTEVVNGQEAVALLKQETFDLILMDLQMPVMDGLTATRMIRQLGITTPIIALTANALRNEIEKCWQAGMNDYVTKPFEEKDLFRTIYKYAGKAPKELPTEETTTPINIPPPNMKKLYDLKKVNHLSRGSVEFSEQLLKIFIERVPVSVKIISDAFAANDFQTVRTESHRVKPSLDSLCIETLTQDIRTLEKINPEETPHEEIARLIKKLNHITTQVIQALEQEVANLSPQRQKHA